MIKNKEITHLEHSRVKLTLTIEKEAAAEEYSKLLSDYSKKIQLPGFRKGKVPVAVLERKYGDSLKAEVVQKIIEDSLKTVFQDIEEKPLPYMVPELQEDYKLGLDQDFCFTVAYDIFPTVELGPYTGLTVEKPSVKITGDDQKRELEVLVEQNSFIVEKDGAAEKDNTATLAYWELDEAGAEIPNTRKKDIPLVVGAGNDIYGLDLELDGMKKGETKTITKTFPEDHGNKDLAGKTKKIALELTGLREKKRPELNDELAQDISDSYNTLEDLKADIDKRLQDVAAARTRAMTVEALMNQVVQNSTMDLPESMVRAELERLWRQFAGRHRLREEELERVLASQGTPKDSLFEEWRPRAETSLKMQLCINKMIENEKIEVSDEAMDDFFREQIKGSSVSFDDMKDYYTKNNLIDTARHDAQEKKLFDQLLEQNTFTAGREMSFTDAVGGGQP
ncbi:MAG: trigger factor [Spirochaetia bacterium]|nr:trigger factor [Spirochaetia bacterium]